MEALDHLNKIPQWGYRQFFNSWYTVKFCVKVNTKIVEAIERLKKKYPMMYVHYAQTGNVIFGGTFHKDSDFHIDRTKYLANCK